MFTKLNFSPAGFFYLFDISGCFCNKLPEDPANNPRTFVKENKTALVQTYVSAIKKNQIATQNFNNIYTKPKIDLERHAQYFFSYFSYI